MHKNDKIIDNFKKGRALNHLHPKYLVLFTFLLNLDITSESSVFNVFWIVMYIADHHQIQMSNERYTFPIFIFTIYTSLDGQSQGDFEYYIIRAPCDI